MIFDMCEAEEIIGYQFRNKQLLRQAFTHSSYSHETGDPSNERLEFLGDGVLKFLLTEHLYKKYPNMREGEMTKLRISMECKHYLSGVITRMELYPYILFGGAEQKGSERDRVKEDVFEATVGAIYLDGGILAAKAFIERTVLCDLPEIPDSPESVPVVKQDDKSRLSEWAQKNRKTVLYELLSKEGPPHKPTFTVRVLVDGKEAGMGVASVKREAEQLAAGKAMEKLTTGEPKKKQKPAPIIPGLRTPEGLKPKPKKAKEQAPKKEKEQASRKEQRRGSSHRLFGAKKHSASQKKRKEHAYSGRKTPKS